MLMQVQRGAGSRLTEIPRSISIHWVDHYDEGDVTVGGLALFGCGERVIVISVAA